MLIDDIKKFNGHHVGFDPCMLHDLENSEDYIYHKPEKPTGKYGLLGQKAIELVKDATALLQFISFEKCRQANLSVQWEMYCADKNIPFSPFQKSYAVRNGIFDQDFLSI